MNINFYVKSMRSFILLSVMWHERLTKCYLLHTDLSEFKKLGKTWQAICFLLSTLNCWGFIEHTSWPSKSRLPKFPRWDSWVWITGQKWNDVPWAWTMGFDAFLCKYRLFWALKKVFPKSMIKLTWCGLPMKWSYVVWKICPQHIASSKALLAARASTSITVDGIGICYDKEAITRLTSFCITTPKLAVLLEAKVAPSKFTFTHCWSGAVQVVACCCRWIDRLGVLEWDSSSCSRECSSILPRGSDGFPNLRLFRRFHRFQVTIANNFAS